MPSAQFSDSIPPTATHSLISTPFNFHSRLSIMDSFLPSTSSFWFRIPVNSISIMLFSVSWFPLSCTSVRRSSNSVLLSHSTHFAFRFRFFPVNFLPQLFFPPSFSSICCWASNNWRLNYLFLFSLGENFIPLFFNFIELLIHVFVGVVLTDWFYFSLSKTSIWCSNFRMILVISSSMIFITIISNFLINSFLSIFWFCFIIAFLLFVDQKLFDL